MAMIEKELIPFACVLLYFIGLLQPPSIHPTPSCRHVHNIYTFIKGPVTLTKLEKLDTNIDCVLCVVGRATTLLSLS